ncbi:MAG TPA: hypothetical protein VGP94_02290 [Tepidisphaeraceae bacterium]|nr:hypothetical protein [Tepidisphaeraceae bacterium]
MLRWSLRILTTSSTLLCLACISLWLRSYWVQDDVRRLYYSFPAANARLDRIEIISASGGIFLDRIVAENDISGSEIDQQRSRIIDFSSPGLCRR